MFDKETMKTIIDVAGKYDLEAAALLAIVDTESAGQAFWTVNGKPKPAVRFEGHYFYARLNAQERTTAIEKGLASPKVGGVKNPNSFAARYALIANASKLNEQAALESVSWGLGQVMGAHWQDLGYGNVQELVASAQSLEGQVDLMIRFIENNDLRKYIEAHDWKGFAKRYNGSSYKQNKYDIKMADAYLSYKNVDINTLTDVQMDVVSTDEYILMQKMLNAVGSYALEEDGVVGVKTKTAIRDFQLKNSLKVDGLYGPITKAELEKAYVAKSTKTTMNISGVGSAVSTLGITISEVAKQIEPLAKISQIAQWVFLGLLVIGVAFTIKATFFSGSK